MIPTHRTVGAALTARRLRLLAAFVIGAAVVAGTTGCGFNANMGTSVPYSPSDGINVRDSGPLEIRNAMIIVDEEGTTGNFVAAVINETDSAETLTMEVGEGDDTLSETVEVEANSIVSFGAEDVAPLRLEGIEAMAGSTLPVYFQSGDAEGVRSNVPVLDGALDYLSTLTPTPSPSASR